jgi:hypothetical protein
MTAMRSTLRLLSVLAASALALAVGGCGEHGQAKQSAEGRAALPHALAQQLAAESDEVARRLATGDGCAARSLATRLRQQTIHAIDAGRVPASLQPTLRSTTADLTSRIRCVIRTPSTPRARPAPPPTKTRHEDHGKHKGKEKHKAGDGNEGD